MFDATRALVLASCVHLHGLSGVRAVDGAGALHGWLGVVLCGVRGWCMDCWCCVPRLTPHPTRVLLNCP